MAITCQLWNFAIVVYSSQVEVFSSTNGAEACLLPSRSDSGGQPKENTTWGSLASRREGTCAEAVEMSDQNLGWELDSLRSGL